MAKRTIEEIITETRQFKAAGLSTFQAMAATLDDCEWDDLLTLVERLQRFWLENSKQSIG